MSGSSLRSALVALMAIGAVALIIAGCGSGSSTSDESTSGDTATSESSGEAPKVAMLGYVINDYTSVEYEGIEKELDPVGGTMQVYSSDFDPQKQLAQCEDAITSQRFNAIVLDPVDSPSAVPCAKQAGAAGLKVIAMENPVGPDRQKIEPQLDEVQGSVVIYPLDDAEHTYEVVQEACEGIDNCKWIVEIGALSSPLDSTKLKYLEEQDKENPDIEILQVIQGNYDPGETVKSAPDALAAHPDVNVYSFESDTNAVAAIPAVREAGLQDQVKLVGDGGSRAGIAGIEDGTLFGTIAAFPLSTGEVAGKMVVEALESGEVAEPAVSMFTLGEPINLTKATIGEYTPQWGAEG